MRRLWSARLVGYVALGMAGWSVAVPSAAEPAIHFVERDRIVLDVRPLTAQGVGGNDRGVRLDVGETGSAAVEMQVLWPDPRVPSRLKVGATRRLSPAGPIVRLESELVGPDGTVAGRAQREILFTSDSVTALFEVARVVDRPLTLAIAGERTREKAYSARPTAGPPVQFLLAIEWVEAGQAVTLETNLLHTFVGQSVRYEFRLGETGQAESASVQLLPVRLFGDTVRVEVEVSGTLPDPEEGLVMVSRREQWLSSSGTTNTLTLAGGDPPTGFRFAVTPRF